MYTTLHFALRYSRCMLFSGGWFLRFLPHGPLVRKKSGEFAELLYIYQHLQGVVFKPFLELLKSSLSHSFGTPWRVQVYIDIYIYRKISAPTLRWRIHLYKGFLKGSFVGTSGIYTSWSEIVEVVWKRSCGKKLLPFLDGPMEVIVTIVRKLVDL